MRRILGVKWDLGLFKDSLISQDINPYALVDAHAEVALEAARKSIVLLENRNQTLPLSATSKSGKIALVGPFADTFNFGDYSGQWGQYPVHHASTIREGILSYLNQQNSTIELVSSWGSNSWQYNNQYAIPPYHLSHNGSQGGLLATYFANMNFTSPLVQKTETPALDWGLYPPPGLPSNNFSVIWEGELDPAVDHEVNGWLGVAISPNSSVRLFVDDDLVYDNAFSNIGTIITNIEPFTYIEVNSTVPPPDSLAFTFQPNVTHKVRIEFATQNTYQKVENVDSLNAQVILFWNLVDKGNPVQKAMQIAADADTIILAVGDAWNSDGENGDRGTLDLCPDQRALADAMFSLNKPVVLLLQGARPFAIPEVYNRSAAILSTYFPGQAAGTAISDVLFGVFNPGGRLPMSIPRNVGQLPVYYNYKPTAHLVSYVDIDSNPCYTFGYGLSYTNFQVSGFTASGDGTFASADTIVFSVSITNNGTVEGSYVPQVYLLQRYSQIVQPVKQLMTFMRVYLQPGATAVAHMELEVDRYLPILNRTNEWQLEKGSYTFALLNNADWDADTGVNVTLQHF